MSDIQSLFAKDPLLCTKDDLRQIVANYRERRGQFNLGNLSAGSSKAPSFKEQESLKAVGKLDIKDLL